MLKHSFVFCLALGFASVASAGFLATDPVALPGFKGSQPFVSGTLNVNVDYAVFAPGAYPIAEDPSLGSEFVYAYQIFPHDFKPVTFFTVGLAVSGTHNPAIDLLHATIGGTPPTAWTIQSSSAVGAFFTPNLLSPAYSPVLIFTSAKIPGFGPASVGDGGLSSQQTLPTPIPEPASLAFGLLAAGALLRRSR